MQTAELATTINATETAGIITWLSDGINVGDATSDPIAMATMTAFACYWDFNIDNYRLGDAAEFLHGFDADGIYELLADLIVEQATTPAKVRDYVDAIR